MLTFVPASNAPARVSSFLDRSVCFRHTMIL